METFEFYLRKMKFFELKNLQPGDKVKYIGKKVGGINHNAIYTFLKFEEFDGGLYVKVKEYSDWLINPKNIIKILHYEIF